MISIDKYFENIKIKTGKTPADFRRLAVEKDYFDKGVLRSTVKAGDVIAWLKKDFNLGHGHSLAIFHSFKS